MAENLREKGEALMADLVRDVEDKMGTVDKIKSMSKLAKDIGEDTTDVDNAIEAIEGFSQMVLKRFGKKKSET